MDDEGLSSPAGYDIPDNLFCSADFDVDFVLTDDEVTQSVAPPMTSRQYLVQGDHWYTIARFAVYGFRPRDGGWVRWTKRLKTKAQCWDCVFIMRPPRTL